MDSTDGYFIRACWNRETLVRSRFISMLEAQARNLSARLFSSSLKYPYRSIRRISVDDPSIPDFIWLILFDSRGAGEFECNGTRLPDPFLFPAAWRRNSLFHAVRNLFRLSRLGSARLASFQPPRSSFRFLRAASNARKRERIPLDRVARFSRATDIIANEITPPRANPIHNAFTLLVVSCTFARWIHTSGVERGQRMKKKKKEKGEGEREKEEESRGWILSNNDAFVHYTVPKRPPLPCNCTLSDVEYALFFSSLLPWYSFLLLNGYALHGRTRSNQLHADSEF